MNDSIIICIIQFVCPSLKSIAKCFIPSSMIMIFIAYWRVSWAVNRIKTAVLCRPTIKTTANYDITVKDLIWDHNMAMCPWTFMVWSTLTLSTYQLRFVSWVFHVIFSFVHFISLYTLGDMRAFRKPLPYNMYLFNLQIANHILINIFYLMLLWVFWQNCSISFIHT